MLTELLNGSGEIIVLPDEIPEVLTWEEGKRIGPYLWMYAIEPKQTVPRRGLRSPDLQVQFNQYQINHSGSSISIEEEIRRQLAGKEFGIIDNLFPYDNVIEAFAEAGDDVRHVCCWSLHGALSPQMIEVEIRTTFPDAKDFFYYENPPGYKSVPGLWHVQVFVNVGQIDRQAMGASLLNALVEI
jgi:hypothetical protein